MAAEAAEAEAEAAVGGLPAASSTACSSASSLTSTSIWSVSGRLARGNRCAASTGAGTTHQLYLVEVSVLCCAIVECLTKASERRQERTTCRSSSRRLSPRSALPSRERTPAHRSTPSQPAHTLEAHLLFEVNRGPVPLEHVAHVPDIDRFRPCAAHSLDSARSPDAMCSRPSGSASFQPNAISSRAQTPTASRAKSFLLRSSRGLPEHLFYFEVVPDRGNFTTSALE